MVKGWQARLVKRIEIKALKTPMYVPLLHILAAAPESLSVVLIKVYASKKNSEGTSRWHSKEVITPAAMESGC